MKTAIVSGVIANKLHNGGAAWTRLSWAVGLARLGYRVVFIEQIDSANCVDKHGIPCNFRESANLAHFERTTHSHDLEASLICDDGLDICGLSLPELVRAATAADFLLNISGHLTFAPLLDKIACRVYIDLDPGYTQHWFASGHLPHLLNHQHFFTVGLNIGQPGCTIPTAQIPWQPILQPIVLSEWPVIETSGDASFTTIASWRGPFGTLEIDGRRLGPKAHEFRSFLDLPRKLSPPLPAREKIAMEIALDIDAADSKDRQALIDGGWSIADPRAVAGTTDALRSYIQRSAAEFSVAQGIYVQTHSGWFSDRTVRYLASGKPAVVQDTGFSEHLPTGAGLIGFTTQAQARDAIMNVRSAYPSHCRAARDLAERYFDSNRVLREMIERMS